jgi:putative Mn2+ efflux pump MntP
MGLLAAGLVTTSLALVIGAAIIAGLGQGLCMRAGLEAVNTQAPAERRAGVASTYFIVMYIGISLPVIGVGIAVSGLGLQSAGIAASIAVAGIAAIALATTLIPARTRPTRAAVPVSA